MAQRHTFVVLQPAAVLLQVGGGGGCVCPVLRTPAVGQGNPTLRPLVEMVGQLTLGLLQPTTVPQRGEPPPPNPPCGSAHPDKDAVAWATQFSMCLRGCLCV